MALCVALCVARPYNGCCALVGREQLVAREGWWLREDLATSGEAL